MNSMGFNGWNEARMQSLALSFDLGFLWLVVCNTGSVVALGLTEFFNDLVVRLEE